MLESLTVAKKFRVSFAYRDKPVEQLLLDSVWSNNSYKTFRLKVVSDTDNTDVHIQSIVEVEPRFGHESVFIL